MPNKQIYDQVIDRLKTDVFNSIKILSAFFDESDVISFTTDIISKLYRSNETK